VRICAHIWFFYARLRAFFHLIRLWRAKFPPKIRIFRAKFRFFSTFLRIFHTFYRTFTPHGAGVFGQYKALHLSHTTGVLEYINQCFGAEFCSSGKAAGLR